MVRNTLLILCSLWFVTTTILFSYSKHTNTPVYISTDAKRFFQLFQNDAKKHGVHLNLYGLTITFSPFVDFGTAAYCLPMTNTVVISSRTWSYLNDATKQALIYHELGHCLLRRDHAEAILYSQSPACPSSLMYPSISPTEFCFPLNPEGYIRELFLNPYNEPLIHRR